MLYLLCYKAFKACRKLGLKMSWPCTYAINHERKLAAECLYRLQMNYKLQNLKYLYNFFSFLTYQIFEAHPSPTYYRCSTIPSVFTLLLLCAL